MTAKSADIPPTIGMELLQFARASAEAKITGQPLPAPPKAGLPGPLNEPRGLFVVGVDLEREGLVAVEEF